MNNIIITTICLIIMTGCAGYYSQYQQSSAQPAMYTFDGEERNFNLKQVPENEDVGSQELISFEQ